MGNQQFTTRHLIFVNCKTAVQVHWDWGWTMQGISVVGGETGVIITGGVCSFILVDTAVC
jgi:hypothetical protein